MFSRVYFPYYQGSRVQRNNTWEIISSSLHSPWGDSWPGKTSITSMQNTVPGVSTVHHHRDFYLSQQFDLVGVFHDGYNRVWNCLLHPAHLFAWDLNTTCFQVCLSCFSCFLFCSCVAGCCLLPFCFDKFKSTTHRCPMCRSSIQTIKKLWVKQMVKGWSSDWPGIGHWSNDEQHGSFWRVYLLIIIIITFQFGFNEARQNGHVVWTYSTSADALCRTKLQIQAFPCIVF